MKSSNRTWQKDAALDDFVFVLVLVLTNTTKLDLESEESMRRLSQSASLIELLCPLISSFWIEPIAQVYASG